MANSMPFGLQPGFPPQYTADVVAVPRDDDSALWTGVYVLAAGVAGAVGFSALMAYFNVKEREELRGEIGAVGGQLTDYRMQHAVEHQFLAERQAAVDANLQGQISGLAVARAPSRYASPMSLMPTHYSEPALSLMAPSTIYETPFVPESLSYAPAVSYAPVPSAGAPLSMSPIAVPSLAPAFSRRSLPSGTAAPHIEAAIAARAPTRAPSTVAATSVRPVSVPASSYALTQPVPTSRYTQAAPFSVPASQHYSPVPSASRLPTLPVPYTVNPPTTPGGSPTASFDLVDLATMGGLPSMRASRAPTLRAVL